MLFDAHVAMNVHLPPKVISLEAVLYLMRKCVTHITGLLRQQVDTCRQNQTKITGVSDELIT